jgi:hypothetical protein
VITLCFVKVTYGRNAYMKINWKDALIVAMAAMLGISIYSIKSLESNMENRIFNIQHELSSKISNIESSVSGISDNIKHSLEEEASILAFNSLDLVNTNAQNGTATVKISLLPKEYTENTTVSVNLEGKIYEMQFENGMYSAEYSMPLFDTIDTAAVTVTDVNVNKNEVLNLYFSPGEDYKMDIYGSYSGSSAPVSGDDGTVTYNLNGSINADINLYSDKNSIENKFTFYVVSQGKVIDQKEAELDIYDKYAAYGSIDISQGYEIDASSDLKMYIALKDKLGLYHVSQITDFGVDGNSVVYDTYFYRIYGKNGNILYEQIY